jgi:hypothetical protein
MASAKEVKKKVGRKSNCKWSLPHLSSF